MKWEKAAEEAVRRVPFFVRKRVRAKVEEEARRDGSTEVLLKHVKNAQQRYLNRMSEDVQGYRVETCFGPSGCPNRAVFDDDLAERLEKVLKEADLLAFLKSRVQGDLKLHHEFRVTIADCPNACSRPQIVDLGLIGARLPRVGEAGCSLCRACVDICPDEAIFLDEDRERPVIDRAKCLSCGKCLEVCPTGTLEEQGRGYRILVGGRLGRRPQLGRELPGIFSADQVVDLTARFIAHHKEHNKKGERWGDIINRTGLESLDLIIDGKHSS